MTNILSEIYQYKRRQQSEKKQIKSIDKLIKLESFEKDRVSLRSKLNQDFSLIAEFKRMSPSKGPIRAAAKIQDILPAYEKAGASAISVLTDEKYFGGSLNDLLQARSSVKVPLLRKDFTVSEYCLYEARAYGADLILLIAAMLDKPSLNHLADKAKEIGLEVLLEIHELEELKGIALENIDILGVNNRDLKTFKTSLQVSLNIAEQLPRGISRISESGIHSAEDAALLYKAGYRGFLVGEQFMASPNPGDRCREFLEGLGTIVKQ